MFVASGAELASGLLRRLRLCWLALLVQAEVARPPEHDEVALLDDEQLQGLSNQALLAHVKQAQEELCSKVSNEQGGGGGVQQVCAPQLSMQCTWGPCTTTILPL